MNTPLPETSPTPSHPHGSAVLCGTDFSPAAGQAANVAAQLARHLQIPLELIHISVIPAYPPLLEDLSAEAERLRQQGTEVREYVLEGNAHEELVKHAKPESCRLMVLASPGKGLTKRWVLGNIPERAAERSLVPTLVVRDPAPFEKWTRGDGPLKVFLSFNFTETATAALRWVKELESINPCDIVVGFVDWPPEERARLGGSGPLALVGNPPEVQAILERDLKARVSEVLGTTPYRLSIEANWGQPDVRLVEMAREAGADLLVVGSHQYHGFERLWHRSVSRGVLHGATMSVAVVPLASGLSRGTMIAPPIRRVLVTTDFSGVANQAIPHAYSLVRGGGSVHLMHVIDPHELPGGRQLDGAPNPQFELQHAMLAETCSAQLRALIPAEAAALGVLTEIEVVDHREPAQAIRQAAERFGADVICLGSHGRSGLAKALLGSVTQQVLAESPRPVFVVRPPQNP